MSVYVRTIKQVNLQNRDNVKRMKERKRCKGRIMKLDNYKAKRVISEIKRAVIGKDECIMTAMTAILAGGHILIEDIPGVGKTTLALAISKSMSLHANRVQFTPDVLPADIIGFSMYQNGTEEFVYQEGPIMCNLFLADEINRTSPKTQSALLEVMEEESVTVDGVTRSVPNPFIVIATENPSGSAGTQLLPESQLDRFMICMSMGYPDMEHELAIVKGKTEADCMNQVRAVITLEDLLTLREQAGKVFIHDTIYNYIGQLVKSTREHPMIELGVSPRGTIALVKMVKAYAFLNDRDYIIPEDVIQMLTPTVGHRIRLNAKARVNHVTSQGVLEELVKTIKMPSVRRE